MIALLIWHLSLTPACGLLELESGPHDCRIGPQIVRPVEWTQVVLGRLQRDTCTAEFEEVPDGPLTLTDHGSGATLRACLPEAAERLQVMLVEAGIFADDFETGDTAAWR